MIYFHRLYSSVHYWILYMAVGSIKVLFVRLVQSDKGDYQSNDTIDKTI